jgi:hypothetical protein
MISNKTSFYKSQQYLDLSMFYTPKEFNNYIYELLSDAYAKNKKLNPYSYYSVMNLKFEANM